MYTCTHVYIHVYNKWYNRCWLVFLFFSKEVWTAAAATKTDWKHTALSGMKPTIVGTQDIFPVLMIRVSAELFSMPLNWYIAEGKGERKGTLLKTLFSVPFPWAPWSKLSACWNIQHESGQHRADLLRETAEGRDVQSHQCFKLFLSLLAPWKSAPPFSGNSTLEKARQYLSAWKPYCSLITHCWICWMRSVNVNEDTVALLPSKGEQLWEPGVSLAVAQKDSALCVYMGVAYAILWTFPGETLRTEKYTVNCMSRRHLKPIL